MLSYMIPVEDKPPPVPNKSHLQLQLELQQQQQNNHHNHVVAASSPLPTVHPESDSRKVIIKTTAGGVKTSTLSSESSVSSVSSSDIASSTTMTPTDKPKPKLVVNGTKHASLKR